MGSRRSVVGGSIFEVIRTRNINAWVDMMNVCFCRGEKVTEIGFDKTSGEWLIKIEK